MYFDGTTLTALLSDTETAAANAPAIAADHRAQTSPLSVIEAAVDLPELGGAQRLRDAGIPVSALMSFAGH